MLDKDIIENLSYWLNTRNAVHAAYYLGKAQGKGFGITNWMEDAILQCDNRLSVPDEKLKQVNQALDLLKEGQPIRQFTAEQN